jgi:hypothetical protein
MGYYVDLDADSLAEGLWAKEAEKPEKDYDLDYFPQKATPTETNLTPYDTRD